MKVRRTIVKHLLGLACELHMANLKQIMLSVMLAFGAVSATHAQQVAPVPPKQQERYDGHRVVRVWMRDQRDLRTMLALSDDPWTCGFDSGGVGQTPTGGAVDFRVAPDAFTALSESGVPFTVLIENVQALVDAERAAITAPALRGGDWFETYKNLAAVNAYADTLIAARPDLISRVTVATLPSGKTISALRICSRPAGAASSDLPGVFIYSCQHAREWITVMAAMYAADKMVRTYDSDPSTRRLVDNVEFWIVPVANPDGYEHTWTTQRLWRKNRRANADGSFGVDLNRNWGHQFGGPGSSGTPNSDTYRGPSAFSEAETSALRAFALARPNIVWALDVHSYGQLLLEPWGYDYALPRDTRSFAQISARVQEAMFAVAQKPYRAGNLYRALYPASGSSVDWFTGVVQNFGTSFELRDTGASGFLLPSNQIIPASAECYAGIRAGAEWILENDIGVSFCDGPVEWVAAEAPTSLRVQFARGQRALTEGTPSVHWRLGRIGPFTAAPPTTTAIDEAGPVWTHALHAGVCGSVVQWYYTFPDTQETVPAAGANGAFEAVARAGTLLFSDDFETAGGWTVGDPVVPDSPGTGAWVRVDPRGTPDQAEFDHTPGTGAFCYVTGDATRGNATAATVDVKTTLVSPVFDLSGMESDIVEASLWLWFSNGRLGNPDDPLAVDVCANGNDPMPTWTRVLSIAPTARPGLTTGGWVKHAVRLSDAVALSATTRLRIVAVDQQLPQNVDAGVDDVRIVRWTCLTPACRADFSGDGSTAIDDMFLYLNAWFSGHAAADIDGVNGVAIDDLFLFLNAWFTGCP